MDLSLAVITGACTLLMIVCIFSFHHYAHRETRLASLDEYINAVEHLATEEKKEKA